ncbi:CD209 antigen-like protein C isoform X2 [Dicentrarchus labrax]|uniref:CD209 antigen-like protein C isoform X2 n=1 Tax=Dicentrarchus labrax TaxID=13489 RepID=UPI0021F58F98|nr:CD209 antigen-like protein C isoform X2 [Dicentrarchus labrax]
MEEIYVTDEYDDCADLRASQNQRGPRSSERRFHGSVVLCLGLLTVLLLVGLIGLGVHYHVSAQRSAAELSSIKANLTERLQASDNKSSSLTEERDLLNARITEMTQELERLQSLSKLLKTYPEGWKMFKDRSYLFSTESGTWDKAREDCRNRGADLAVINSDEEQTFVSKFYKTYAWIGLTKRGEEGTWKWIDGTPLTLTYWATGQPSNGSQDGGEEDCVHTIKFDNTWNDRSCKLSLPWVCEKTA